VTGYQGGERNEVDDYVVVRQSDAHAWAEVWLEGEGWRRVDPTAAILPSRIERGLADLPAGEPVPFVARVDLGWLRSLRHQWEAANNAWNQWVLSYDQQKQRELLSRLGMAQPDWRLMTIWLASLCALFAIALTLWAMRRSGSADALARIVRQARAQQVGALLLENISDPRLIERIAREAGVGVGGALYSDALSPPGTAADTYLRMFAHNVRTIVEALEQARPAAFAKP
jgi:hypothetical protein